MDFDHGEPFGNWCSIDLCPICVRSTHFYLVMVWDELVFVSRFSSSTALLFVRAVDLRRALFQGPMKDESRMNKSILRAYFVQWCSRFWVSLEKSYGYRYESGWGTTQRRTKYVLWCRRTDDGRFLTSNLSPLWRGQARWNSWNLLKISEIGCLLTESPWST